MAKKTKSKRKSGRGQSCARRYYSRVSSKNERKARARYRRGTNANKNYRKALGKAKKLDRDINNLSRRYSRAKSPKLQAKLQRSIDSKEKKLSKARSRVESWAGKAEGAGFSKVWSGKKVKRVTKFKPKGFARRMCKNAWTSFSGLTGQLKEAATFLPGAIGGVAGASLLPNLPKIEEHNEGWKGVGLSVLGAVIATGLALKFASRNQALAAGLGGLVVILQKGVAQLTSPDSQVRKLVGLGLNDIACYAGLEEGGAEGDLVQGDVTEDDLGDFVGTDHPDLPAAEEFSEDPADGMDGVGEGPGVLLDEALYDLIEVE